MEVRRGMGSRNGEQSTERCGVEGGVRSAEGFIGPLCEGTNGFLIGVVRKIDVELCVRVCVCVSERFLKPDSRIGFNGGKR